MQSARDREVRAVRRRLEELLAEGSLDTFQTLLEEQAAEDLLEDLRERKLVLRARPEDQPRVRASLASVARRCLAASEADAYSRALDLMPLLTERMEAMRRAVASAIQRLPLMELRDLLSIADKAMREIFREMVDFSGPWSDPERTIAAAEREWHDANWVASDMISAICRAVNEVARAGRPAQRLRPERRAAAVRVLKTITAYGSELNALEWIADSVAFGDLQVEAITGTDLPVVKLGFRDERHSLLRTLALRRQLMMEQFSERPIRFVREFVGTNLEICLTNAILAYERVTRPKTLHDDIAEKARERIEIYLNTIDFEDDMVVMAAEGSPEVIGRYLLAGVLRCHVIAAEAVGDELPASARRGFLPARIELPAIIEQILVQANVDVLRRAWDEQTVAMPAASHWDLVRRPFVRDGEGRVRPLLHGSSSKWNADVRERLVQGGLLAKRLGALWEDRFAQRFQEAGWTLLGKGVRLKAKGRLLTDLDLLLLRDDLLLIAQVKAIAGSPQTAHDHWRQRKVVEKGCRQAALALAHLGSDLSLVEAVAGKRVASSVAHVEAAVLTNSDLYEGYEYAGIPVLGETMLKAITIGSKVQFTDHKTQRVLSTTHFIRPEELDTPTIISAMRTPIELRIAPENGQVRHVREEFAGLVVLRPEFAVDENPSATPRIGELQPISR